MRMDAQFSESYPLPVTETSHHTHFDDEFWWKTILDYFCQFLDNPPMFKENLPKKDPF